MAQQVGSTRGTAPAARETEGRARETEARETEARETEARETEARETEVAPGGESGVTEVGWPAKAGQPTRTD